MSTLAERAAALLAAADKYKRYGMGIADIDDGWEAICDAGNLIRELLEENERLCNMLAERTAHWRDAYEAKDAGPSPFQGRTTRRTDE